MGQNNNNYTHFAVNKNTNLIVNGWDYSGYDKEDLRLFKRDYFFNDLEDNDFNPKEYKILTYNGCKKQGINPDDDACWSNDGIETCVPMAEGKKHNPPKTPGAAMRNASRKDDIENHGKPIAFQTRKEKNPKAYDRKKVKKVSIEEAVSYAIKKVLGE